LRVFENRVLGSAFGLKGEEMGEAGEDCTMKRFIIVPFTKYYYGDQIREDEMHGACSTHARNEKL
jgi:hypothetical protein